MVTYMTAVENANKDCVKTLSLIYNLCNIVLKYKYYYYCNCLT